MKRLYKKNFEKDDKGVSGAITAMMIILIISSFVSLIYAVYVPNWTKEDEADHSKTILSQFLDLKSTIDDQIINRDANIGISVTSKLTLGREGGPIFGMGSTTGNIVINPYEGTMEIKNTDNPDEVLGHARGNITFESKYIEYVNQKYIYEFGAVLVTQHGENGTDVGVMKVEPHFRAEKDLLGNVTITMVQVAFFGDKTSTAGTKDIVIETTLNGVDTNHISRTSYPSLDNLTLNISTQYPDIWEKYFNKILDNNVSGMDKRVGPVGDYSVAKLPNMVSVRFWNVNALNADIAVMGLDLK